MRNKLDSHYYFDWELMDDTEYGVIVLEHKPRGYKSTLTSEKWILETPNKKPFFFKRGKWLAEMRPIALKEMRPIKSLLINWQIQRSLKF